MQAREFMVGPLTVAPDLPVRDLVALLLREHADGACVIEADELVGVVTTMDLVFQEKQVHLPSFLAFMDFMIPLEPPEHFRHEIEKITANRVRDMMTPSPRCVGPETRMAEVASLMVDQHITIVPVVEEGRVLGMITKSALLLAVFPGAAPA